ncbi:MAG: glycosyltransferase [Ginsengibacter sp.]
MNILRTIASMDPATGGPCQGIRNSIPELKKLGVRNEVVCQDDPDAAFLSDAAFPIHAIGKGKGPWRYNPKLIPWLLKNLQRFDVVIVHGLWLYPSYAITKSVKLFKNQRSKEDQIFRVPKIFIMPHGMLDPYFQEDRSRKLKAIRNWYYWKLVESKVVNNADALLFTCEEELMLARKPFRPYNPKKEINVGYGIKKPPTLTPKMKQAFLKLCPGLNESPYFLFLSRIHEKKGVDLLVKAYLIQLKKIVESGKQFPKLVIAGPGADSSFGLKLRHMVNEDFILHENVFFAGLVLEDAKWGAYYGCEAFILPSHQENFGIVVVEALACLKPVLISDKVNIWQEINNAGAGIVKNDSLEGTLQLFESWEKMTDEEKESMQLKSKSLFEKNYTSAAAASKFLQAISE